MIGKPSDDALDPDTDSKRMCPRWKAEPLLARLQACKSMPVIHGLLADAEAARVQRRIMRLAQELAKEDKS